MSADRLESNVHELLASPGGRLIYSIQQLLRARARVLAVLFVILMLAGFPLAGEMIEWLVSEETGLRPAGDTEIIILHPVELILLKLKLSVYFALIITSLVLTADAGRLLAGSEPLRQRLAELDLDLPRPNLLAAGAAVSSLSLILAGLFYSFEFLIPFLLEYLAQDAAAANLTTQWTLSNFVGFISAMMFASAIGFQVPVFVTVALRTGVLERAQLSAHRRHLWFAAVVLGAVLSPPDPVSLLLVALPMVILFELSMLFDRVLS